MFFVEMNRFFKRSEVASVYNLPDALKWVVSEVPTSGVDDLDGDELVLEEHMDRAVSEAVATSRPDGPYPPDTIRVGSRDYPGAAGLRWRLLKCLWGRGAVAIDKVIEEVWGHDAGDRDTALASLIKHTRGWLRSVRCPLTIQTQSGYVRLLGIESDPSGSRANCP
jgi:hypothetical protein